MKPFLIFFFFVFGQVSVISKDKGKTPSVHWFTGTPDPTVSFFKPFVFVPGVDQCKDTVSPSIPDDVDPAKVAETLRLRNINCFSSN